jgi:hypothetical protein
MVEVVHDRKERRDAWWYSSRYLWHDLAVYSPVCPRVVQAARVKGERCYQGADWWSWYVIFPCPPFPLADNGRFFVRR